MISERNSKIKTVFALVLAVVLGIAVAIGTMFVSGTKSSPATVAMPGIKVYIRGAVNNPGLYEVGADLRLCELIDKAGGSTENANLEALNLAAILIDGTTVTVPSQTVEETKTIEKPVLPEVTEEAYRVKEYYTTDVQPGSAEVPGAESEQKNHSAASSATPEKITSGTININIAGKDDLMRLPGVGEATANKIISYRDANGEFKAIEEIMNVSGIGEKKFEGMQQFITVE
ncbi:MAG: helix-hairpin-helix domain-containing protein [Clostridia bacterium]|nr:helix-hairpin-helix domain-containing protein [Clostridia bacterium]